jgi:hypothetical protein
VNITSIESRFTPEMLAAIRDEVDSFVQERFTLDDYSINKHLIDTFFIQPLFYATLLNYYTMYEQRSTISMSDIYKDDIISPSKKDAYFASLSQAIGLGSASMDRDEIVSSLENRLTISDTKIHSDMMQIVRTYDKAKDGATGVFWTMFRNSPDHMYFTGDKFGIPIIYENITYDIELETITTQPIILSDVERYKKLSNGGRVTNFIDIYVDTKTEAWQQSVSITVGEEVIVELPRKKWKKVWLSTSLENEKDNVSCTEMEDGYLGFGDRTITLKVVGPFNGTVRGEYYKDTIADEDDIISEHPEYDIKFFGMLPLDMKIKLKNGNSISRVKEELGIPLDGGTWSTKIVDVSRILNKNGNSIVGIDAELYINPLCKREVKIYNNELAIEQQSILSWVDIDNTCIQAFEFIDMETGNVTTI